MKTGPTQTDNLQSAENTIIHQWHPPRSQIVEPQKSGVLQGLPRPFQQDRKSLRCSVKVISIPWISTIHELERVKLFRHSQKVPDCICLPVAESPTLLTFPRQSPPSASVCLIVYEVKANGRSLTFDNPLKV